MTARTLNEMLARSVERSGDRAAFIFKDQEMSYVELAETIERCAAGLSELGIGKGDTFGIVTMGDVVTAVIQEIKSGDLFVAEDAVGQNNGRVPVLEGQVEGL